MSPPLTVNSMKKRVVSAFAWCLTSSFLWFDIYLTVETHVLNKEVSMLGLKRWLGTAIVKAGKWGKSISRHQRWACFLDVKGLMRSAFAEATWKEDGARSWSTLPLIVILWHLESWSGIWTIREWLFRTLRKKDNFTEKNRPVFFITN